MKILLFFIALFLSYMVTSQDYFAVVVVNEDTTYNYPSNSEFTLFDTLGNEQKFDRNEPLTVEGDYTLSIKTYWKTEPEIIKSEGGKLELFILPIERRNWTQNYDNGSHVVWYDKNEKKPGLERKELTLSHQDPDRYNLLAVFTNDLVFKYNDGYVRAWLKNKEVEITNQYLVETPEGLLKLSFDPTDGEFWYVFEN